MLFINPLYHETMVAFNARRNSFIKCVITLQLNMNAVSKAGFFYSGKMIIILIIFHRSF